MDAKSVPARMNLAALSLNYRDYTTAEQSFRAVLQQEPKNYDAIIGLGVSLRGSGKVDEAEQQYTAAQTMDPQDARAYFNLGLLYQEYKGMEKTQLLKAQQFYRDFIQRSSGGAKRGEAEKRIKDIDAMLAALEEAERMQKEAEEMQRKMEEQQRQMQEELKKMQEQEAAQQGAGPQAANAGAGGAAAAPAAPAPGATKAAD
jgi:Tfp pilus assembly protein PilF